MVVSPIRYSVATSAKVAPAWNRSTMAVSCSGVKRVARRRCPWLGEAEVRSSSAWSGTSSASGTLSRSVARRRSARTHVLFVYRLRTSTTTQQFCQRAEPAALLTLRAVTKLRSVECGDRHFWAFDRSLALWLRELIEVAVRRGLEDPGHWLADDVAWWRVVATVDPYGLTFSEDWSEGRRSEFLGLAREATKRFSAEWVDPGSEGMRSLSVLDGEPLAGGRGLPELPAKVMMELGAAIQGLIDGTLPADPPGGWWLFGYPPGPSVIAMRSAKP
jgi:hypothetical protein